MKDPQTGEAVDTKDGDWWWHSSDPSVLKVAKETGSDTMQVSVEGVGSAMILAWYEPADAALIDAALTDSIPVYKRPLTIAAKDQGIYVGGALPELPSNPVEGTHYTVESDRGGLLSGHSLTGLKLAYSPVPDTTRPGTYSIVASGASVMSGGVDVSGNYYINYVNGELTVRKPPAIPAKIAASSWTYDGKPRPLATVTGAAEGGAMLYSLDGATFSPEIPSAADAGEYTVWYKAAGDDDHSDSELAGVSAKVSGMSISTAKVALKQTSYTYNGNAKKPAVNSVKLGGKTLKAGTDYTVSYKGNVNAGKAKVTVTGKGNYAGTATAAFKITKVANKLTVKTAKKTVKASYKAQTVQPIAKAEPKFAAKVTYKKAATAKAKKMSGYKVLSVDKKTGKVKVKAGTAPGTYKLTVTRLMALHKNPPLARWRQARELALRWVNYHGDRSDRESPGAVSYLSGEATSHSPRGRPWQQGERDAQFSLDSEGTRVRRPSGMRVTEFR